MPHDRDRYNQSISRTYRSRAGRLAVIDRAHGRFTRSAQRGVYLRRDQAVELARYVGVPALKEIAKCPAFGMGKSQNRRPCYRHFWCPSCWARRVAQYFIRFEKLFFGKSYGFKLLPGWAGCRLVATRRRLFSFSARRPWDAGTRRWLRTARDLRDRLKTTRLDEDYRRFGGLAGVAQFRVVVSRQRLVAYRYTCFVQDARGVGKPAEEGLRWSSWPRCARKALVRALAGTLRYPESWWDRPNRPLVGAVCQALRQSGRSTACYGGLRTLGDRVDEMPPAMARALRRRRRKEAERAEKT